jgi:hypothetical protein
MAEQLPNGDALTNADIEMKEESVAEAWFQTFVLQRSC